jgi:muconolactone delta-isomerase
MQFLVLTRRKLDQFPTEMWTPELLENESQHVRAMYTAGSLRSIWRRKDMPGAAIIFEAASEEEARAFAATLPLAKRGMIEFPVVTQLEPYPGFGPL